MCGSYSSSLGLLQMGRKWSFEDSITSEKKEVGRLPFCYKVNWLFAEQITILKPWLGVMGMKKAHAFWEIFGKASCNIRGLELKLCWYRFDLGLFSGVVLFVFLQQDFEQCRWTTDHLVCVCQKPSSIFHHMEMVGVCVCVCVCVCEQGQYCAKVLMVYPMLSFAVKN